LLRGKTYTINPNWYALALEVSSSLDNHAFAKGDFTILRFYWLDIKHYIMFNYVGANSFDMCILTIM